MTYAYHVGPEQPSGNVSTGHGQAVGGCAVGILVLDLRYPLFPGNVANGSTWNFPVLYKVLKGTGIEVLDADPSLLPKVIEGGRELEAQGVRAIVGSCGYFGFYQQEAAAFKVPTFMSSLLQIPMILQSLNLDKKLGIICAASKSMTSGLLAACGIGSFDRLVVAGAMDLPEFSKLASSDYYFDNAKLERELVQLAVDFVQDHPDIGAILLECSDMPPYAHAIQNAVKRPVFDFITMISWIQQAVVRRPVTGFM